MAPRREIEETSVHNDPINHRRQRPPGDIRVKVSRHLAGSLQSDQLIRIMTAKAIKEAGDPFCKFV